MIRSVNAYLKCVTAAFGLALATEANAAPNSALARQYQAGSQNAPLCFEAVPGANGTSHFRARGGHYDFRISATEAQVVLSRIEPAAAVPETSHRHQPGEARNVISRNVRMRLEGADPKAMMSGTDAFAGRINYLRGTIRTSGASMSQPSAESRFREYIRAWTLFIMATRSDWNTIFTWSRTRTLA